MKKPLRERSPLIYVLVALIPYSRPNLLLAFKPNMFFRELEKVSRYKQSTLRAAFYRAQRQKLIEQRENLINLTAKARMKIAPFVAEQLGSGGQLMIIFDIPEDQRSKRRQLRQVLKEWQFTKVQQSVWLSGNDYLQELEELTRELGLIRHIKIYECIRRFPK